MIDHNDLIGKKVYRAFDKKTFVCCSLSLNPHSHQLNLILVDLKNFEKRMLNCFELAELGSFAHVIEWDAFMENYTFSSYKDYSQSEIHIGHNVLEINWQLIKKNFIKFLVPLIPKEYQKNTGKDHP